MNTAEISIDALIATMEARLNTVYTDEQREFIKSFTAPTICFASPGTGKTTTAIGGLITAELGCHIPGQNIYALSFTKMATAELCVRHRKALDKLGVPAQMVNFRTLHSLCSKILEDNFHLLGMSSMKPSGPMPLHKAVRLVEDMSREKGHALTPDMAKKVVLAVRDLNSSLIFDEDHVLTKKSYKDTHVDFNLFTALRKDLFDYCLLTEIIPVDHIILYTLKLLTEHPEVSKDFKSKCKIMLVDEAQDFSLLHLRVISLLTDCLVMIGDMKQQIYAFNGACQEIVQRYYELYPTANTLELNQSFRCHDEILNYANTIITPNGWGNDNVKGIGDGGAVQLSNMLSLSELADQFSDDYESNHHDFTRDVMFLFRNNASAIPIAEQLYQRRVPLRVNKHISVLELPVLKELLEILTLCRNPYNMNYVGALAYLIPELRTFKIVQESPFYKMVVKSGGSVFEVNYMFHDPGTGSAAMSLLSDIAEDIKQGKPVRDLLNKLYPMYAEQWLNKRLWMLEYSPAYYIGLVQDIVRDKTFDKFVADESAKAQFIKECNEKSKGIRCYTMHAAKGLEADDVYILDSEEGIIPNLSKLNQLVKSGCGMDAAREIRNERSLCYVAITRARDNVYIVYNKTPAAMIVGENPYTSFDDMYREQSMQSDDIDAFNDFVGGRIDTNFGGGGY